MDSKLIFFLSHKPKREWEKKQRNKILQVGKVDWHELTNLDLRKWLLELAIRKAEKQSSYPGEDPKTLRVDNTSVNGCEGRIKTGLVECVLKDHLEPQILSLPQLSGWLPCLLPPVPVSGSLFPGEVSGLQNIRHRWRQCYLLKTRQLNGNLRKTESSAESPLLLSRKINWTTSPKGSPLEILTPSVAEQTVLPNHQTPKIYSQHLTIISELLTSIFVKYDKLRITRHLRKVSNTKDNQTNWKKKSGGKQKLCRKKETLKNIVSLREMREDITFMKKRIEVLGF